MKLNNVSAIQSPGGMGTARFDNLVITVSREVGGYEVLVEVDKDEDAPNVVVDIGTAVGDSVVWEL